MNFQSIIATVFTTMLLAAPAHAGGYMTVPNIHGESTRRGHETQIEIDNVSYAIEASARASVGAGRARARATAGDFVVTKKVDAASAYIALASFQQKSFDEIEIVMTKPSGSGSDRQYYTIKLTNVRITSVDTSISERGESSELVGLAYEEINIIYNTAAGDEHEIEYDIASGV